MYRKMRSTISNIDRGLLIVLVLCLLAAWSFLVRPSLPRETDTELHVFRTAELGYVIREGHLYTRWAPDFYYGYGYPIFNYYAPFTYYFANVLTLAIAGGAVFGVKAVFIIGFLIGGAGMYGLGKALKDSRTGIIAATSFLFAPYIYYLDPHSRGVLAEFFALCVAPAALWSLAIFKQRQTGKTYIIASLLIAITLLSHNLMAPIMFALFGAFTFWQIVTPATDQRTPRTRLTAFLPHITALLLVAFFWLPVALESDAVQLGNLIGPGGHFDFRNHFVSFKELFSPSVPLDLGAVNPVLVFNLGVAQWVLGLCALVGFLVYRFTHSDSPQRKTELGNVVFWGLCSLGLIFLITPASTPLWEALTPMAFIQFPWRLLGPAAICLAVLGGYATTWFDIIPQPRHMLLLLTLVLAPLISTLPIFILPDWGAFGATDRLAMLDFELAGYALGTTSTGDYLPVDVDYVTGSSAELIEAYRRGGDIDRIAYTLLPDYANVELISSGPVKHLIRTQADQPFALTLYTFYFAGWRATIDGEPAEILPVEPNGFISIEVPSGQHEVKIWLGTTPPRTSGTLLTLLGFILLAGIGFYLPREHDFAQSSFELREFLTLIIGILVFCIFAFTSGLTGLTQPYSPAGQALPAHYQDLQYFEGGINLIGYDLPNSSIAPGDVLSLRLYWFAREPVPGNYQVFAHLTSIPEHAWAQSDKLNPGDYPTSRWPLDQYVTDPHKFVIPYGTPPGEYTLRIGLWNHGSGVRQLVLEADGAIIGDTYALPLTVIVDRKSFITEVDELPLTSQFNQAVAPGIELTGISISQPEPFTQAVGLYSLDVYWLARKNPAIDYDVMLRVLDSNENVMTEQRTKPADGTYPTTSWETDEIIRDLHSFWVNEDWPEDTYTIEIAIVSAENDTPDWLSLTSFERQLSP